jgi:hypothetical protein
VSSAADHIAEAERLLVEAAAAKRAGHLDVSPYTDLAVAHAAVASAIALAGSTVQLAVPS